MFHISSDREQLRGCHDALRGVDDDLVGRLKRNGLVFAQSQRVQRAVAGILVRALKRERPRAAGEFFLPREIQVQPDYRRVGHEGRGYGARGLGRGEEAAPVLHDGEHGLEADLDDAGHHPADHLAPPPI